VRNLYDLEQFLSLALRNIDLSQCSSIRSRYSRSNAFECSRWLEEKPLCQWNC